MKKIIVTILSVLLAVGMVFPLSGCADKRNKEAVRIIAHTEQEAVLTPFFEKFMKANPDIEVDVMYGVDQLSQLETDFPPDLLFISNLTLPIYKDLLVDLGPMLSATDAGKAMEADFIDNTLNMMKSSDSLLALPLHTNVSMLYYNKKLFNDSAAELRSAFSLGAADSVYPTDSWTWDDFAKAGKVLTLKNDNGTMKQWGSTTINTWWGEWLTYARQMGGDFMDANGSLTMDTPQFKAGMEFFKNKCYGANAFAHNPTNTGVGMGNLGGFAGRKVAMEFGGHTGNWVGYNEIRNFEWDVAELPTPVGRPDAKGAEIAVEGYGIYKNALNKDKAFRVLSYMFSADGQESFARLNKLVPTQSYKELILSVPKNERPFPQNMEAVFATMENGVGLPTHPGFEQGASTHIVNDVNKYISNAYTSVDAFVTNAVKNVQNYLNSLT